MNEETKPIRQACQKCGTEFAQPGGTLCNYCDPTNPKPMANLERAVDANSLAVERLETKAAELNLKLETLRKQATGWFNENQIRLNELETTIGGLAHLEALKLKADAPRLVTMPHPLPGQEITDQQFWAGTMHSLLRAGYLSTHGRGTLLTWTDDLLQDFKARFRKPV